MNDIKDLKELLKLDMKTLDAMAPSPMPFPLKALDVIVYKQGLNFYSEEKLAAVKRFLEESPWLLPSFLCCRVPRKPRSPRNTRHRHRHHPLHIAPPLPPSSSSPTPSKSIVKTRRDSSSDEEDKGKKKPAATRKRSRHHHESDETSSDDDEEIKKPRKKTEKKENMNMNKNKKNNNSTSSTSGIVIPELPELFKAVILSLHGTDVTFVMKKEVTKSDLEKNNSRLSMPEKQINSECKFLTDPEIRRMVESRDEKNHVIGMEVGLIEPSGEMCSQVLKRWKMTSAYTYNIAGSSWKNIADRNNLKKGELLNIWCFNSHNKLFFLLHRIGFNLSQSLEEVLHQTELFC